MNYEDYDYYVVDDNSIIENIALLVEYIDKLLLIYNQLEENKLYKNGYADLKAIDENFLNQELIELMDEIPLLIRVKCELFCNNDRNFNLTLENIPDLTPFKLIQNKFEDTLYEKRYSMLVEYFWKKIPNTVKIIYSLTCFQKNNIKKKEIYERFVKSIYILKSGRNLNFLMFSKMYKIDNLIIKEERFFLDRNNIENREYSKNLLFYYKNDNKELFIEHLKLHIYILYYKDFLKLPYQKIPILYNKIISKSDEKKKYINRINEIYNRVL